MDKESTRALTEALPVIRSIVALVIFCRGRLQVHGCYTFADEFIQQFRADLEASEEE